MLEAQIKHMVDRFLSWKLPDTFRPDGGIQFDADALLKLDPRNRRHEPYGTNLFDAGQADAMVRHMIADMPQMAAAPAADVPQRVVAYTRPGGSYPGYINITPAEDRVTVTVRGDPSEGRCGETVQLNLTRGEWSRLLEDIAASF